MAFKRRGNDRGVIYPSIPSGKFLKDDGSWAVVTSESTIEDAPVINHSGSAISSNWAYRHSKNEYTEKHVTAAQIASFHDIATAGEGILINGQQISVNFSAVAAKVHVHTIDDEPLDGHTTIPISSNWAADHEANRRASKHITSEQLSALHAPVTITGTGLNLAGQMLSIDYGAVAAAHTHEQYLTDAPGNGSFYARRNGSWQTFSLTGGSWGTITGTLSDQTDLQNALNAKISMPVLTDHAGETLVVNSGETAFEFASVCLLNEQGLIDSELLPGSVVGALVYRGVFNPVSGAPIPASQGYYYISSGIGTISGTEFSTGDWLVYRDSSTWDRIANSEVSYYWDNILEKPASFMPEIHGNERHTDEYITIDALTGFATTGDINTEYTPFSWNVITEPATMISNNGYISNSSSRLQITLPETASVGDIVRITGMGEGGWKLVQHTDQQIHFLSKNTIRGITGYIQSTHYRDSVELICVIENTDFNIISSVGTITMNAEV